MLTQTPEIFIYPDGRLNTKNAALYLGLSQKTIAMMRCNGTGPKFIKRGRVFYFLEDLNEWLNQHGKVISTIQAQFLKSKSAMENRLPCPCKWLKNW